MKNEELDRLLKSVPPPARAEAYWSELPKRVTAKIHWQSTKTGKPAGASPHSSSLAKWGWALAAACVIAGLFYMGGPWPRPDRDSKMTVAADLETSQLAEVKKYYDEIASLFPHQVQAIVFDQQGPHLILAEKANIPNSPPLYVKACGPKGCEGFVTFSGQQIQLNGERCEVLADKHGQVILVGDDRVWSGNQASGEVHIEARPLGLL